MRRTRFNIFLASKVESGGTVEVRMAYKGIIKTEKRKVNLRNYGERSLLERAQDFTCSVMVLRTA